MGDLDVGVGECGGEGGLAVRTTFRKRHAGTTQRSRVCARGGGRAHMKTYLI